MKNLFARLLLAIIRPALELDRLQRSITIDCGSHQVRLVYASACKHESQGFLRRLFGKRKG